MTPYQSDVFLPQLSKINRVAGPVPGSRLAQMVGLPERTVRRWLRQLEAAGVVARPDGVRSGWQVIRSES